MKTLFLAALLFSTLCWQGNLAWADDADDLSGRVEVLKDDIDDDISDIIDKEKEEAEEEAEERAEQKLEQMLQERFGKDADLDELEDELEDWLEQQLEGQQDNADLDERLERELEKRLEKLGGALNDDQLDLLDDKLQQLWQLEDDIDEALLPALADESIALLSEQELQEAIQSGAKVLDKSPLGELGMLLVTFDSSAPTPKSSAPNHLYQLDTKAQNTKAGQDALTQAKLMGIKAQQQAKQRIGMMDSSINTEHPCLKGQAIFEQPFHPKAQPSFAHGTAMASIILGKSGCKAAGVLSQGELYNAVVFAANDQGLVVASASQLVQGLNWLLENKVSIINMSLSGPPNKILERALQQVAARSVTLLASAGNDGPEAFARFPAAYPEVIAVTAIDNQRAVYDRAGQGAHIEIAALGVDMAAAQEKGVGLLSGTSLASAIATALLATEPAFNGRPDFSLRTQDLGEKGRDKVFGFGLLENKTKK